jgi:hypothetical protein
VSAHWRLAARYTGVLAVLAGVAALAVGLRFGVPYAGALGYGFLVGLVSFLSTAATVSMLTARSAFLKMLGATSLAARYGFVAGALGVPAYLELWPVTAMMAGFAGVYLTENVVLLPGMLGVMTRKKGAVADNGGAQAGEKAERRVVA